MALDVRTPAEKLARRNVLFVQVTVTCVERANERETADHVKTAAVFPPSASCQQL